MVVKWKVFFRQEYLDHLWNWSTYFGWISLAEIYHFIFDKLVHCCTSLYLYACIQGIWKRYEK